MPKLLPGDPAPNVSLQSLDGTAVSLADAWSGGPAVVTFYRGDFCPMCNRYLHALSERHGGFAAAGVRIAAISSDRPELGRETARRHDLPFSVFADPERRAIDASGVIYNEAEGHAEPAAFVIDSDGTLAYEAIVSGPLGRPSVDDLLAIATRVAQQTAAPAA